MSTFYYLKPEAKLILSESLAIIDKKIIKIPKKYLAVLKLLAQRPLFKKDLKDCNPIFFNRLLNSIAIRYKDSYLGEYEKSSRADAKAWRIKIHQTSELYWPNGKLKLNPGDYFINFYFPEKIVGDYEITYFKQQKLNELRDDFIMDYIQKNAVKAILELGCGSKARLAQKILKLDPQIVYIGIDKKVEKSSHFIQGDFLKNLPVMQQNHLVIAEEVFEHLQERKLIPFIKKLKVNKATSVILTTPNHDFNSFIEMDLRHDEHKFEWSEERLLSWIEKLKTEVMCKIKIEKIGKKIQGVAPSWGIIITF